VKAPNHRRILSAATACIVALLTAASLHAATIYVSTAGNDADTGQTWQTAKQTVQAGLNAAASGDEVWVAAGTYVQCITLKAGVALYGGFAGGEMNLSERDWVANVTVLDGNQAGSVVTAPGGATVTTRIDGFAIRNGFYIHGGGVHCSGASPTIANNTIVGNSASQYGGGLFCANASPTITNNTIAGNRITNADGHGAGICCYLSSSPTITNNTISGNSGASTGGGISRYFSTSSPTITGNTIVSNSAGSGGGICCESSGTMTIANNTITGNIAVGGGGGGIYADNSSPAIINNTIMGNSAYGSGGGIGTRYSSAIVAGNTVMGNGAPAGGGIGCDGGSPTISNTIVAFNSAGVYMSGSATASLLHNCVYGNTPYNYSGLTDPTGTDGNISVDPELVDTVYGNLHIQPDSPCVDAGDDSVAGAGWTDMDGQPRKQGAHVDIGADESDGTAWSGGPYIVVRVSPNGDDAQDGSSWPLAKRTVQAGIDAAASVGGEVWVAVGTYVERIALRNCAYVYGGFAGGEAQRSARDWKHNSTVLDGNQGGSVVTAIAIGPGLSTIDGFVIGNGNGTLRGAMCTGGGIYCYGGSPTIANCAIAGNSAPDGGGGISCSYGSPTIVNNTITGNSTSSGGGGIGCGSASTPTIINNTITGNKSGYSGGGIAGGAGTIANNVITGNTASSSGGGIYCAGPGLIANNTIAGNISFADGGGIYCNSCSPTIVNTIIAFNSSGICNSGGSPSVRYGCVYGNSLYNYSGLADPTGTNGNISGDPKLACPPYANVHIQTDSPCVDTGDDSAVGAGWTDMDGQSRIAGPHVDMGADESDGTVWPPEPPVIVRVSLAGDDAHDGSSWTLAKRTVQAGIDAAAPSAGQVWVASGTYVENIILPLRGASYGGFAGDETDLSQRNWQSNVTVLDGNQAGSVVTAAPGGGRTARVDGFTIRNGGASSGGGIYCVNSSPTIANNTITGNSTMTGYGGGIYCDSSAAPMIVNNAITGNTAYSFGGGVYCGSACAPMIANNLITGNAGDYGGGIFCLTSSPTIASNTIVGNRTTGSSAYGGGVCCWASSPTIVNTIVVYNTSGIYKTGTGTVSLRHNCVYSNTAYNYSGLTNPTGSNGNIAANPRFVSVKWGPDGKWGTADDVLADLHLLPGSACIDAGNNADVPADATDLDGNGNTTEPLPFDLAGAGRFADDPYTVNTGAGTAPIVDIGAYEHHLADANGDGQVDVVDLLMLVYSFGTLKGDAGYDPTCDFNHDSAVDVVDLLDLVYNFGT
jgi:hypothetical protein